MTSPSSKANENFAGLRALAGCGGCAAKAPKEVVQLLAQMAADVGASPAVLVGLDPYDDAAVYALDAERALIATVDFFPPLVDDPSDYGRIAAANAVSDVYAMGGTVALALAISGFPMSVPTSVVAQVAAAAAALVRECGGLVLGGHSIRCAEPVFGLCVLGFVHPKKIWRKAGARAGDVLMLSKALGTGLLVSSGRSAALASAVASMKSTNRAAAASLGALANPPHAVTDVSGYGLIGHLQEMVLQSSVTVEVDAARVPLLAGALAAARAGVRTSAHRQTHASAAAIGYAENLPQELQALLEDPQTSGGLLASVAPESVAILAQQGFTAIGSVRAGPPQLIVR